MLIIATHLSSGRLRFLANQKFIGAVTVVGVVIALLAYIGDEQGRREPGPVTPAPGPTATASPATASPAASSKAGGSRLFALSPRPVDDRTVEVAVTPPENLAPDRVYWFFVEVDWGDGNTDYYPREKLTGKADTLTVTIPPDAPLDAKRAGRVYSLTAAQSAEADVRLERQQTTRQDDFFPDVVGTVASGSVKLPFGT
ncbi:hypothetical protein ACQPZX_34485 [Actinoplanes sp. CA-142083]|uniref:hypothetical protein n=1 Tax=Actinoplanes sp. CA-142083 TaxID=3239903 RepID=UPI003D8E0226